MRPMLLEWHGFRVPSYPALLYLGLVAGVTAGNLAAHAAGLDAAKVFAATIILTIPALVGARLLHVAAHWSDYRREPGRIWRRSEGGAAMYGGLAPMLLASVPLLGYLNLPLAAFWDVGMITILVGMAQTGPADASKLSAALCENLTVGARLRWSALDLTVEIGEPAPDFIFEAGGGRWVALRRLRGREVILAFWTT